MKNYVRMACAVALGLSLAACSAPAGQTSTSGEQSASEQSTSQTSASNQGTSTAAFEGTWKMAALLYGDATVTGNFTAEYGTAEGNVLTLTADGTGNVVTGSDTCDVTWKPTGEKTLELETAGDSATSTGTLEGNSLLLANAQSPYGIVYTKDGVYEGEVPVLDEEGTPITTTEDLVGTWKFYAVKNSDYGNYLAFGEAADLAKAGGFTSGSLVLNGDGTGTLLGYDMTWSTTGKGTSMIVAESGAEVPIRSTEDGIVCVSSVDGARYWFKK